MRPSLRSTNDCTTVSDQRQMSEHAWSKQSFLGYPQPLILVTSLGVIEATGGGGGGGDSPGDPGTETGIGGKGN